MTNSLITSLSCFNNSITTRSISLLIKAKEIKSLLLKSSFNSVNVFVLCNIILLLYLLILNEFLKPF